MRKADPTLLEPIMSDIYPAEDLWLANNSMMKWYTVKNPFSTACREMHGCIRLAPIVQYSPLLPPVGVWTVSQFQCGWSSSQTS